MAAESTRKRQVFAPVLYFVLIAALMLALNVAFGRPLLHRGYMSWTQWSYGLLSAELCAALYLFGVGRFSPHWRPDPPEGTGQPARLLSDSGPADGGSHPLGPPLRQAPPGAGQGETSTVAVQAVITEKKPEGGQRSS